MFAEGAVPWSSSVRSSGVGASESKTFSTGKDIEWIFNDAWRYDHLQLAILAILAPDSRLKTKHWLTQGQPGPRKLRQLCSLLRVWLFKGKQCRVFKKKALLISSAPEPPRGMPLRRQSVYTVRRSRFKKLAGFATLIIR